MIGVNLFGEMQEYYDPEIERIKKLKEKIKKLIEENEDYEMYIYHFSDVDDAPDFDTFFEQQADHLVKLHDKCKDWNDFVYSYYFCAVSD